LTYGASGSIARRHSMYLVIPPVNEASRTKQHAATSQVQFLTDHAQFITHHANHILLIDASNCLAAEVEKSFRAVPEVVTARPRRSVLILSDVRGTSIGQEAIRVMKETAVFGKAYVKKSAWTGAEECCRRLSESLGNFFRRERPVCEACEKALAWRAKD
jgi:hypothetical protein